MSRMPASGPDGTPRARGVRLLRVVGSPEKEAGRRARIDAHQQALRRRRLAHRTRNSLDGLGIVDIEAEVTRVRQRISSDGAAASEQVADDDVVLHALEEVLDWMLDNNVCVYHCQLR